MLCMACENASVATETSPGEDAHHTIQILPCTVCFADIRFIQLECMVLIIAYSSLIPC